MYTEENFNYDMLKLAGAAGLISITNNPYEDLGLRKQAEDTFEVIASLHPAEMGEEFVKVAYELYDDQSLMEILAGHHLDGTFEKVASVINIANYDSSTLEKVAAESGTSPTAAKAVAHELSDSAANIEAVIDDKKIVAESRPDGAVSAGGENVNNMEGYNPLNNPEEYDIDVVASVQQQIHDAYLVKEAAEESYNAALQVLQHYGQY